MNLKGRPTLVAALLLFVLMLAVLLMMNEATQNSQRFSRMYGSLLGLTTIGLVVLLGLIVLNVRHLARQLAAGAAGARLTLRMVVMVTLLTTVPVLLLYSFSLGFLHRGIDSWFDLRVGQALDDSLELSRLSLDIRMRELLQQSGQLASRIAAIPDAGLAFELDALRTGAGARELTVLTRRGGILFSSSDDPTNLVPTSPAEADWLQLSQGGHAIRLEPGEGDELYIHVALPLTANPVELEDDIKIMQALYPVSAQMNELAGSVQQAYQQYQRLAYLRSRLKVSFIMILTLVLLFALFGGIWAVFFITDRLVAPIRELARGTRALAAGDYDTRLAGTGGDELGFLVASFNDMAGKVAGARSEVEASQRKAEAQRAYLQAVLGRIPSGVMVLAPGHRLGMFNVRACDILGVALQPEDTGCGVDELCRRYASLAPLCEAIARHHGEQGQWQEHVVLFSGGGRRVLQCSCISFSYGDDENPSHVVVLEDITMLLRSQRDAAMAEVARRLAHEIKNPLTPIQLSAERLRRRYQDKLEPKEVEVLERLTNTIVQQVGTMRDMVDAFRNYARPPKLRREQLDLNRLINETLDLYRSMDASAHIATELAPLPPVHADASRIRQVFNNLLDNAFDAGLEGSAPHLQISSRLLREGGADSVELRFRDAGRGLGGGSPDRLFEPYVTTKAKGTGLGLAIVRKNVEDHSGIVWLEENRDAPGVCVVIRLPIARPAVPAAPTRVSADTAAVS